MEQKQTYLNTVRRRKQTLCVAYVGLLLVVIGNGLTYLVSNMSEPWLAILWTIIGILYVLGIVMIIVAMFMFLLYTERKDDIIADTIFKINSTYTTTSYSSV